MRHLVLSVAAILASHLIVRADAPADFEVGAFKFQRPAAWGWIEVPEGMRSMRKAQIAVPGKDGGKPAEIIFYHFGAGQGGDTQANVSRWVAQFSEKTTPEKIESKDAAGTKATFVSVAGTYQSGMPMGPKTPMTGYALLGAILEDSEGGSVFVKMTGPEAVVKEATPAFNEFITAAKK
ncbi:MAG TPA: hypothetical protein VFG14_14660 [Chthoniobacteraceae bacterium]|nr:hypothetical protein [Chthoniobacteraceae bacterium]